MKPKPDGARFRNLFNRSRTTVLTGGKKNRWTWIHGNHNYWNRSSTEPISATRRPRSIRKTIETSRARRSVVRARPDDTALHRRLAKLPESSPQLVRLAEVWEGAPQDGDALSALSGVEGEVLRTYGFGVRAEDLEAEGDPESFLDHLVSALESELDDQRASS